MKKKLFIGALMGLLVSVVISSAAYAYNGDCRARYSSRVNTPVDEATSHNYTTSESQPVSSGYGNAHVEVKTCGCPWYRRWTRWHQNDCGWDANCTSNRDRTKSGCC